jgi:hypothetical protein
LAHDPRYAWLRSAENVAKLPEPAKRKLPLSIFS